MNWRRARTQKPEHREEVLVRCRGIISLAVYNANKDVFELKDGDGYDKQDDVYWVGVYKEVHSTVS